MVGFQCGLQGYSVEPVTGADAKSAPLSSVTFGGRIPVVASEPSLKSEYTQMLVNFGLEIEVVDPDDDYLGIEVSAASERFAGSARIFAGLGELSELADSLRGFPSSASDKRRFEFGTRSPGCAGGFVSLSFYCRDGAGHPEVAVEIDDDADHHTKASGSFSFAFEASALDHFIASLPALERTQRGRATLVPAGQRIDAESP